MLVICEDAAAELARLGSLGGSVNARRGGADVANAFSRVDGAVLLGIDGSIAAFGVVVDGESVAAFDQSRGARYNSARRYVHWRRRHGKPTVAVVASADGSVDIVPRAMASIPDVDVADRIARVEGTEDRQPEQQQINADLDWLRQHAFYLTAEQCARLNLAKRQLKAELLSWANAFHDFHPSEDFVPELYLSWPL
jgi:hypothetical protein